MNRLKGCLALAAVCLALPAAAAPAPDTSPGPISDYLRLRGKQAHMAAPRAMQVQGNEGALEVERQAVTYVAQTRVVTRKQNGREVQVQETVVVPVFQAYKTTAAVKDCKFFTVGKGGKLEPLDADKAAALLKKPTTVLTGESAEVDPRYLEIVKPGTLYLVLPEPMPVEAVAPRS
jgi:hypothetical protein